ncbi:MAG TPA: hypothetical protein PK299_09060 [Anaerolineales bacterium]|nr:hypothetical protein [Anaerolineales bacterium]
MNLFAAIILCGLLLFIIATRTGLLSWTARKWHFPILLEIAKRIEKGLLGSSNRNSGDEWEIVEDIPPARATQDISPQNWRDLFDSIFDKLLSAGFVIIFLLFGVAVLLALWLWLR